MKHASIQTKFLIVCIFLVLLATVGISATYYLLTRQDKQRETRDRILIAFDILLDEFSDLQHVFTEKLEQFLEDKTSLRGKVYMLESQIERGDRTPLFASYVEKVADELKSFGRIAAVNRLALYTSDKQLLAVYEHDGTNESTGIYLTSPETGKGAYLSLDNVFQLIPILLGEKVLPDTPPPDAVAARYENTIPTAPIVSLFRENEQLGLRVITPIQVSEEKTGVLLSEIFYTQDLIQRSASLSKTAMNVFAGEQFSIGTLPGQDSISPETLERSLACEDVSSVGQQIEIVPLSFENVDYYQTRCALHNADGALGVITVSLSQEIEKQEIAKILKAVFLVSLLVLAAAFILSILFSRRTIHTIQDIVKVIGDAAEGDLRTTATVMSQDELGMLATRLNQMIAQLRSISGQVQDASYAVHGTADTILQQMDSLVRHLQQQSHSVDDTTASIESINQFIDVVSNNTNELLSAADQILSSIHETTRSINEVSTSTGTLTNELQLISSSVEQVNHAIKHISSNTSQLAEVAEQTDTGIQHIDRSLKDVSHNADQAQQLARETMNAVTSGQESVDASIEGMKKLKDVVANTAQIIHEANSWGERVSSILGIVDEITEQTSLLALNASIISAQAGSHGRGFAVVADEIKELATRTKDSTKEISSLVRELRMRTEEGVKHTEEGLEKADQEMQLANAVKEALTKILDSATRSSKRAADTVQVVQETAASSQGINSSMKSMTEMVARIRHSIQEQDQDIEKVFGAIETISGMSEQVNRATIEQRRAAQEIAHSMEHVTQEFSEMSEQTETLQQNSTQIVEAMHTIESSTEQILQNANSISGDTVKNLVQQSKLLQHIVSIFKVT